MIQTQLFVEMPFVDHAQVSPVLQQFNKCVASAAVMRLCGPSGVGKSRLLKHWVLDGDKVVDPFQMVMIQLPRPHKKTFGETRMASPVTLLAFSRLWYVLQRLDIQRHRQQRALIDQRPAPLYGDSKFCDVLNLVQGAVEEYHIRVLVVDNAQFLDIPLLEQLLALREACAVPFAIIFSSQLEEQAEADTRLLRVFDAVRGATQAQLEPQYMQLLTEEEFFDPVLPSMFLGLDAEIANEVEDDFEQIAEEAQQRTQGNWYNINHLALLFDDELRCHGKKRRMVTQEVVTTVFTRFDVIHAGTR